ncbi:hypothetical protein [Streptomyces thioluteus]
MRERQWYLDTMQAERMWQVTKGKGVTVAVIDSGVRSSQPELEGRLRPGKSFVDADRRGAERGGHRLSRYGHGDAHRW